MQINLNKQIYLLRKNIMRTFGFITAGVFVLAWLFFPNLFQWWAIHVWSIPADQLDEMGKLGPLGDIYGSLNTLFTSATLLIVIYSAFLQRQANKDAREAMAEQLKQAKEASAEQLEQAKESTKQQLDLAQATHDAQIQETKNSFFTNQFYSLLNYKNESIKNLVLRDQYDKKLVGYEIFLILRTELVQNISIKYNNEIESLNVEKIRFEYESIIEKLNNGHRFFEIFTYFEIYISLFKLVDRADIDKRQKDFFYNLIRQSSTPSEQITLFFLAPIWDRLYDGLGGCRIFNSFATQSAEKFALKFYNKNYFYTQEWNDFFDKQQTPA
ncbi:TPA: hypothetical protein PVK16_002273 [Acinetobacter baumannii]|uniref:hypothetical protein n=1 Tax=Acinetobacter baumannii TaxID=470 RepID=UPI0022EC511D|nr:hypothetical protein [Acinetobacter baumannii]HDK8955447.1 hypothetical protein [Acinetobacter baumannii]HDR2204173.1 hypothetical protein [Acinetobacter baumannii]